MRPHFFAASCGLALVWRGRLLLLLVVMLAALLALLATHATLPMLPNRTTIECAGAAISQEERANCTITTRNEQDEPTAGASASDFVIRHAHELRNPTPLQGGPIHWYVEFDTCKAGAHNVTVQHGEEVNVTASATVVASRMANFTLDCQLGRHEVVAGERVVCAVRTLDECANPTATPSSFPSTWTVQRTGSALLDGDAVVPVHTDEELALFGDPGGGVDLALRPTSRYEASFRTGRYWTAALNHTERGVGGLIVSLANVNWTEVRSSSVAIRAAELTASRTRIVCLPETGLLERHIATCRVSTFDAFDNPQIGASPEHFTVTYLSNPANSLGTSDAGPLLPTDRLDTFETHFQAVEEGTAGITVSVAFAADGGDRSLVVGTVLVKGTELVLFPSSAVMKVPITLTVNLDTSGATHLATVLRFVPGGQVSPRCTPAACSISISHPPAPSHAALAWGPSRRMCSARR